MRGGVGPSESDGVLVEAPPSVDIPINLILHMPLRFYPLVS